LQKKQRSQIEESQYILGATQVSKLAIQTMIAAVTVESSREIYVACVVFPDSSPVPDVSLWDESVLLQASFHFALHAQSLPKPCS
jgi:hypothetical protein